MKQITINRIRNCFPSPSKKKAPKENYELIEIKGGFELYIPKKEDMPSFYESIIDWGDEKERLKIVAHLYHYDQKRFGNIYCCLNDFFDKLNNSGFSLKAESSLSERINKLEVALEEDPLTMGELTERGLIASGHDTNYAITDGIRFGANSNYLGSLPIYLIPPNILAPRLIELEYYHLGFRSREAFVKMLGGSKYKLEEQGMDAIQDKEDEVVSRAKGIIDRDVTSFPVQRRIYGNCNEEEVRAAYREYFNLDNAYVRTELERHKSTLKILEYLESRVEQ